METIGKNPGKIPENGSTLALQKPGDISAEIRLLIFQLLAEKFPKKYKDGNEIDLLQTDVRHDINLIAKDVAEFLKMAIKKNKQGFGVKSIFNLLKGMNKSEIVATQDKLAAYWLVQKAIIKPEMFFYRYNQYNYNGKDGEFWKQYRETLLDNRINNTSQTSEAQEKSHSYETKIQKDFFSNLGSALRENSSVKKGVVTPYSKIIADKNKVHPEDAVKFIIAIPSLLGHYLYKMNPKFRVSEKEAETLAPISQANSFVLCHALSIHSDSIFLLADIGRFIRFAKIFKKPYKLFLTDVDFAELNWTAQRYSDLPGVNIRELLEYCASFRKKLYERFDFGYSTPLGRGNIQNEFVTLDTHKIAKHSSEYHLLSKEIIGEFTREERLTKEEVTLALEKIDLFINNPPNDHKFFAISRFDIFKEEFLKHIEAIKLVIEKYKSYSEETFSYFLLQYYHQFSYNNCLKIACEREKDFDETF
ncbi:MAG: hypothetical protein V9E88_00880 [Ferruginibacter sp.]